MQSNLPRCDQTPDQLLYKPTSSCACLPVVSQATVAPLEINHRNALWSISIFGYLLDYAFDGYIAHLLQNLATILVLSNPSSTRQPALVLACLLCRRQRWLLLRFFIATHSGASTCIAICWTTRLMATLQTFFKTWLQQWFRHCYSALCLAADPYFGITPPITRCFGKPKSWPAPRQVLRVRPCC